ncbi:MAG: kynureninase, partial [Bdellovibrionota bacterium]
MKYEHSEKFARAQDSRDPLKRFRGEFLIPKGRGGKPWIYLAGNSLGLQPKKVKAYIEQELKDWAKFGVEGHFLAKHPWLPYHEILTEQTARLVGAKSLEVVVMNTLTVNVHLMMVSFYRPTRERYKILVEGGAFPSDQYAVASQARFHGRDPREAVLELKPRAGEATLRTEDILSTIEREGSSIALVLLGSVNYLTGQAFDVEAITRAAHAKGSVVGFDFAHGAGNLHLKLHEWGPDFAVWCGYKYLNSGPGSLSGCFVHERHAARPDLPRFSGWWGHDKSTRFQMGPEFKPIPGAEGWQLSNPPIFQMASLRASMELFDQAKIERLRAKSEKLTGYLEFLLDRLPEGFCKIITPRDPAQRGAQLSL